VKNTKVIPHERKESIFIEKEWKGGKTPQRGV